VRTRSGGAAGLHFETNGSTSFLELLRTGTSPLYTERLQAISGSVLRLVRLDGWMEDVRPVLDLEVEGVVRPSNFVDDAEDLFLPDITEGAVLWWGKRNKWVV